MRSESEIKAAIKALEGTIAMPGDGGPAEAIIASHAILLHWVMGEENGISQAFEEMRRQLYAASLRN